MTRGQIKILVSEALCANADYYLKKTDIDDKNKTFIRKFFVEGVTEIIETVIPQIIDSNLQEAALSASRLSLASKRCGEAPKDLDKQLKSLFERNKSYGKQ